MKTFWEIRESKNEQMTPAQRAKAMADFKKRGGKVKKIKPGYAQGWTGKDDPGKDMHGMMDRARLRDTRKKNRETDGKV